MRWRDKPAPDIGAIRIVNRFIWFPKCIGGEWRWMERSFWNEQFIERQLWVSSASGPPMQLPVKEWVAIRWVE